MHCASYWRILGAWVIVAMLALSGCGGGGSVTAPLGVTSTASTSQAQAASAMEAQADALFAHARGLSSEDPEDDENVWELVAEAWTLVAEAARLRAEAATAADNTDAAEAWTLAAHAADGYAQAATALATETQNTGSDTVISPERPAPQPVTVVKGNELNINAITSYTVVDGGFVRGPRPDGVTWVPGTDYPVLDLLPDNLREAQEEWGSNAWFYYGRWSNSNMSDLYLGGHQHDETGKHIARFGVANENDDLRAYAATVKPLTDFADSPSVRGIGSVYFDGTMLGFTNDSRQPIGSNVEMNLDLGADITGTIEFYGLSLIERDASLTDFLGGTLTHDIAVDGNTFTTTGGDAGTVTGAFAGETHSAAAGTIEHPDFMGAFGAAKDQDSGPTTEAPVTPGGIATAFGTTNLDHYPLDAQNVRPVRPEPPEMPEMPELLTCATNDHTCQLHNAREQHAWEVAQVDYLNALEEHQYALGAYESELTAFEAGQNWRMVKEESGIASRDKVFAMLEENIYGDWGIFEHDDSRWYTGSVMTIHKSPPVVRFVSGQTEGRIETRRALDNINAWLPYDRHLTFGEDVSPQLLIDVDLALETLNKYLYNEGRGRNPDDPEVIRLQDAYEEALSAIYGKRNVIVANLDANEMQVPGGCGNGSFGGINIAEGCVGVDVIQHELLHALGLDGGRACYEEFGDSCDKNSFEGPMYYYSHVPVSQFPESEMAYASPFDDTHGLSQIDGETIQVIYTRLVDLDHPSVEIGGENWDWPGLVAIYSGLAIQDLGPWDDFVVRYSGSIDFGDVDPLWIWNGAFGVDWRHGMARPWADGIATHRTFANSGLTGSATWIGELVGFTPAQEAVHGDSAIEVDLRRMTGEAAFTALEHWNAGAAPGVPGTGTQWKDGDLRYSLGLHGNYLRSKGGDEGYVSGRFVGREHEGVVGILERPDLTGAFGATRQTD